MVDLWLEAGNKQQSPMLWSNILLTIDPDLFGVWTLAPAFIIKPAKHYVILGYLQK